MIYLHTFVIRFVAAIAVVFASLAFGAAAENSPSSASPFVNESFAAACQRAADESKIVFIDFYTTWCGPCKMLDDSTWKDDGVIALLREKTIALKIDAEREIELAKKYQVRAYPTLLLARPDGIEIGRIVGFRPPARFLAEFADAFAGRTPVDRAEEQVNHAVAAADQVRARYDLGKALAREGRDAEALRELLWCFDEGMKGAPAFSGVRVSFLVGDLSRLARTHPPAADALRERRDAAAARDASAEGGDKESLRELIALNSALGEGANNLQLFDRFPAGDQRRTLFSSLFDELVKAGRHRDALEVRPVERQIEFLERDARLMAEMRNDPERAPMVERLRKSRRAASLGYLNAILGAGELEQAKKYIAIAIAADSSEAFREELAQALERAGHPELLPAP